MADQLQRAAREPPGDCGHGAGVRPGANPAGRGAAVSAAEQLETSHHKPEGDQSQATDVAGRLIISALLSVQLVFETAQLLGKNLEAIQTCAARH